MFGIHWLAPRLGAAAIVLTALIAPPAGSAQDLPPYAAPAPAYGAGVPSYARPAQVNPDETIHGRIRSVDGAFNISVDDDRGFVDRVQLHQGTIINPTGLTLSPGMSVTILGVNTGSTFSANEIDTPYTYAGPLPTPVYYGPGYWCPGFAYGYGPSFSLAIVIGGDDDRPWYFEHRRFYGRPWDGHGYFGAYVGEAPASRGLVGAPRSFTNPARHPGSGAPTNVHPSNAHPPTAFAGRTFAGEPRAAGDHFNTLSNGPGPAQGSTRSAPGDRGNGYLQAVENRGYPSGSAPAGAYPSGSGQGYAAGSGPMRGPSGSGSGRTSAGGPGGGSARATTASHGGGGGGHAH